MGDDDGLSVAIPSTKKRNGTMLASVNTELHVSIRQREAYPDYKSRT
jgi:hypothetical protein